MLSYFDATLPQFTPNQLREFLSRSGWTFRDLDDSFIASSPKDKDGNRLSYLLPLHNSSDLRKLAISVLEGASIASNCTMDNMLKNFSNYLENSLTAFQANMRLKFGDHFHNSISLQEAENISKHSRLAIAHSIETINSPVVYRPNISKNSKELSKSFAVGQERGSYIFVISTPLDTHQPAFSITPGIYAQAILRIAKGFQWLSDNPDKTDDYDEVARASSNGLNANIAQHLAKLFKSVSITEKQFLFNFNAAFAQQEGLTRLNFPVSNQQIKSLESIYDLLSKPNIKDLSFQVRIVKLSSKNPNQESFKHKVTAEITSGDSTFVGKELTFDIPQELYLKAYEVHGQSRTMTLKGDFEIFGPKIKLLKLKDLT